MPQGVMGKKQLFMCVGGALRWNWGTAFSFNNYWNPSNPHQHGPNYFSQTQASEEAHAHTLTPTHSLSLIPVDFQKADAGGILKLPVCKKTLKRCHGVLVHRPDLQSWWLKWEGWGRGPINKEPSFTSNSPLQTFFSLFHLLSSPVTRTARSSWSDACGAPCPAATCRWAGPRKMRQDQRIGTRCQRERAGHHTARLPIQLPPPMPPFFQLSSSMILKRTDDPFPCWI